MEINDPSAGQSEQESEESGSSASNDLSEAVEPLDEGKNTFEEVTFQWGSISIDAKIRYDSKLDYFFAAILNAHTVPIIGWVFNAKWVLCGLLLFPILLVSIKAEFRSGSVWVIGAFGIFMLLCLVAEMGFVYFKWKEYKERKEIRANPKYISILKRKIQQRSELRDFEKRDFSSYVNQRLAAKEHVPIYEYASVLLYNPSQLENFLFHSPDPEFDEMIHHFNRILPTNDFLFVAGKAPNRMRQAAKRLAQRNS